MTLPRFRDLTDYWLRFPPAHLSISAIVGALGGKTTSPSKASSDGYEPPDLKSTNELGPVLSSPAFSDAFPQRKMRVIKIDKTKVN